MGNGGVGVFIDGTSSSAQAQNNVIGLPGEGNVISGNAESGVTLYYASGTVVQGDKVGTTADGLGVVPGDYYDGIRFADSPDTLVGGTTPGTGNLVSLGPWNSSYIPLTSLVGGYPWGTNGIDVFELSSTDLGSAGSLIEGNLIGTDVTGTKALGDPFLGIALVNVGGITVGGTAAGAGNVIAACSEGGIGLISGSGGGLSDVGSSDNLIEGNLIGINFDSSGNPISGLGNGGAAFPQGNDEAGIYLNDPADPNQVSSSNTIGGTSLPARPTSSRTTPAPV